VHWRWAGLVFSVSGALLASPPAKGALRAALLQLAAREWGDPSSCAPVRFGVSTRGRWLWTRTLGSTVVGQGLDSAVFVTLAFGGLMTGTNLVTTPSAANGSSSRSTRRRP